MFPHIFNEELETAVYSYLREVDMSQISRAHGVVDRLVCSFCCKEMDDNKDHTKCCIWVSINAVHATQNLRQQAAEGPTSADKYVSMLVPLMGTLEYIMITNFRFYTYISNYFHICNSCILTRVF